MHQSYFRLNHEESYFSTTLTINELCKLWQESLFFTDLYGLDPAFDL